jgi:branched-chain amino acid transport system permease protein
MNFGTAVVFLEQGIATGVVTGGVYALLAISIVSIFRTTAVANFAVGEIFMAGAYIALYLLAIVKVSAWIAIPVTIVAVFVGSAAFQLGVLRTVHKSGGPINLVIATLGLSYLLKGIVRQTGFGETPRSFPSLVPAKPIMFGMAHLTLLDVAILAAAMLIMAGYFLVFGYTRLGRAMRAVGMNQRAAQLVGVNIGRMNTLIWGLSGALSAAASLLIAPKLLVTADMGTVGIMGFAAAIIGGFSSFPGAIIGGFVIGIAENLVGLFIASNAIAVTPFVMIISVLVLRPQGLFGGPQEIKKV